MPDSEGPAPNVTAEQSWSDTGDSPIPPYVGGSTAVPRDADSTADLDDRPTASGGHPTGTVIGRRYRLVRPLGEGGMGSVFLAEQTDPIRRQVALKLIKPGMDSVRVLARFEAERQALARMDHPHIARVLDAGTTDDARPFFAMEVVDGAPLTTFCDAKKLPLRERLALFAQVCRAVQHAHQKGILHRDLKPSNILVAETDGVPTPKVIDFGLAKALGDDPLSDWSLATGFGSVLGTPLYMSPEQAGGNPDAVDTRADVYALGVILYELLTGTTPLERGQVKSVTPVELLRLVREVEAERPSARLRKQRASEPASPARPAAQLDELDWIALKALAKEPDRRYDGAGGLADDVARFLANEPVSAAPPSRWYRTRKFVRRNRGPVLAASLVLLAVIAGGIGTTVGFVREADQRRLTEGQRDRAVTAEGVALARLAEIVREKERADEEADTAREVASVLQHDILRVADVRRQADCGAPPNPNLTLREALERAAVGLDKRFRGRPKVEAAIRRGIGEALEGMGHAKKAVPHLERAFELTTATHGPNHIETLAVMNSLGTALRNAGETDRAIAVLTEHFDLMQKHHGISQRGTLTGMGEQASTLAGVGRTDEALKLFQETVRLATAAFGPDDPDTLVFVFNHATLLAKTGQPGKAIPLMVGAIRRQKAVLRGDHPDIIVAQSNLSDAYAAVGDHTQALASAKESADAAEKHIGLTTDPTPVLLDKLGRLHLLAGDAPAAVAVLERAARGAKAAWGAADAETLGVGQRLATAYHRAGRPADAKRILLDGLKAYRATKPPGGGALASGLLRCGEDLLDIGAAAEAEAVLRECVGLCEKLEPDGWAVAHARSLLGGALAARRKYETAEPLLLAGYSGLAALRDRLPPNVRRAPFEAANRLCGLYSAWAGKGDELAEWQAERAKYGAEVAPPPRRQ